MQSSALDSNQVLRLLELNAGFEVLHRNFDFRVNTALTEKAHYLQVLNAQLVSRLGFSSDEINATEREVMAEIVQRGVNISAPDAECIVNARLSLENALDYAGYSMNGLVGEVMWYIGQIEGNYFYPLINILQLESNLIQWTILSELRRSNPVTNVEQLIQRIEDDYYVMVILYQSSVANIESEMLALDDHMNEVKSTFFPQLDSTRDYFTFTANFISDSLTLCNA